MKKIKAIKGGDYTNKQAIAFLIDRVNKIINRINSGCDTSTVGKISGNYEDDYVHRDSTGLSVYAQYDIGDFLKYTYNGHTCIDAIESITVERKNGVYEVSYWMDSYSTLGSRKVKSEDIISKCVEVE